MRLTSAQLEQFDRDGICSSPATRGTPVWREDAQISELNPLARHFSLQKRTTPRRISYLSSPIRYTSPQYSPAKSHF